MSTAESTPLRVLHVLEALEGGTARHLVDLVRWTPGIEQHVAIPPERIGGITDTRAAADMQQAGATIHLVQMTRQPVTHHNARSLWRLDRLVGDLSPQVVHAHSSIGGLLGRIAARRRRVPAVYTPNGVTDVRAGVVVERALRRVTDRFVAVSHSEADRAVSLGVTAAAQLVVVPNGIDTAARPDAISLHELLGVDRSRRIVGTISRLVSQKDPERWVEMASLVHGTHPDVVFVMIGDGELRPRVDEAIRRHGLGESFHLVPNLPGAAGALTSMEVFVLSSVFEGAPYAPMEAMREGTPVVLTRVAGSEDIVTDGFDGLLVPARDSQSLAAAVVAVLDDATLARRLVEQAEVSVRERFGVDRMGAAMADVYRSLV